MSIIAKSQSLMRDLQSRLQLRLPTFTFTQSQDSQGAILLVSQDSTPSAGEQVCAIRCKGQASQFSDIVGNAQRGYSPMVLQVIEELSTVANVSLLTLANKCKIDMELDRLGVKQERYSNPNGTVPATSEFAADGSVTTATLVAEISPDLYWPLSGQ